MHATSDRAASVSPAPLSPRKLRANRRNARKSTGPRTAEGKKVSSRNATTHALFCRDLVLPGEDEQDFHLLRESILRALKPQDAMELALVDRLVCDQWRLKRLQRAEMALYDHRDQQLREHRRRELEKLQRDFRFTDATSACRVASHVRAEFARYEELRQQLEAEPAPAAQLAAALLSGDAAFERLGRYEQRLQHGVHRCLRDLHALRAKSEQYRELPESPFSAREEEVVVEDAGADEREGQEAAGEQAPRHKAGQEEVGAEQTRRDVATGSAVGCASANVQNEPTAAASAASPDAADAYPSTVIPSDTPERSREHEGRSAGRDPSAA